MDINNHFGVYGVCYRKNKLLCIEKNAGPYKGRFDLPGGSQEIGEGLTDTLVREVLEETGYTVLSYSKPRVYDAFVKEEGMNFMVHHIMVFYYFKIDNTIDQKVLPSLVDDGANDSERWVELDEINVENSSPLVLKIKQELLGEEQLDKVIYSNWTVK
ncbi:NUDIX domain [Enterococcus durans]|uniref:NUDIX domain n=1 Tax=Enterococcus durans TaxID=53345 RepID=A0A377KGN9_9ENTE|nr:NUDIX hydrolase [Enterococcus durans]STP28226.1 NUDIX domain [Enterococcus durans]